MQVTKSQSHNSNFSIFNCATSHFFKLTTNMTYSNDEKRKAKIRKKIHNAEKKLKKVLKKYKSFSNLKNLHHMFNTLSWIEPKFKNGHAEYQQFLRMTKQLKQFNKELNRHNNESDLDELCYFVSFFTQTSVKKRNKIYTWKRFQSKNDVCLEYISWNKLYTMRTAFAPVNFQYVIYETVCNLAQS